MIFSWEYSAPQKNILLIWDRMGDYHRARWHAIQEAYEDRTVYAADLGGSDSLYEWQTTAVQENYFLLSTKRPDQIDLKRLFKFINILSSKSIGTICVAGYGRLAYILFLIYGKLTGRKVILFAESWYPSSNLVDYSKGVFLKSCCHGFLVSGMRAFDHFNKRLNIPAHCIRIGYSVVDNNHFARSESVNVSPRRKILLTVARFSPEKNIIRLIEAFKQSTLVSQGWKLKIIGGGPLKNELLKLSQGLRIELMDWQPYEKLPGCYHEATVFCLPSTFEPWGLVVNEAMAASLPVALSAQVGCVPDLLEEKKNGWIFDPSDIPSMVSILKLIGDSSSQDLQKLGKRSLELVNAYSTSLYASHLKELIDRAVVK